MFYVESVRTTNNSIIILAFVCTATVHTKANFVHFIYWTMLLNYFKMLAESGTF